MQAVLKKPVRNSRKTRIGIVTSDKMDKTIVVQVEQLVKHKLYKKYINRRSKFKAQKMNAKLATVLK